MSRFYLCTFGCRCNQSDSAAIRRDLRDHAFAEANAPGDADLLVVNSCTVTQRADQQVRQAVRRLHRENAAARVVVTGCYAERDPQTLAGIEGVDLVIGNAQKHRLAEIVGGNLDGAWSKIIRTPLDDDGDYIMPRMSHAGGKTRPFVKLQDGCDARCSYCIVPAVRGPGRSAQPEDILAEMRSLIGLGYREIVLTGVHLGAYGRTLPNRRRLADVLQRILALPGLGRLRLGSIEPMRFDRSIVQLAAENPAFAPHFHIPVQSGSDRILRRMRRPYTASRFLKLLQYIQVKLPSVGLGTDVMVGFPGESEEDFEASCRLIESSPLAYLHVFPYSPRDGTDACNMPEQVPAPVVRRRARVLRQISRAKNLAFRSRFVGRVLKAITLSQEEGMENPVALTENYIHALVARDGQPANRLVNIRIDEVQPEFTRATVLGES